MPDHPNRERKKAAALPAEDARAPAASATAVAHAPPKQISSDELFGGAREIAIEHNGRRYQLRITQSGKLILTA